MKIKILLILIFLCFGTGCQKVLTDYEINKSKPALVVEGLITDSLTNHYIKLSYTSNFYTPENTTYVENAIVIVADDNGFRDSLIYDKQGYYRTKKWAGKPGNTYYLDILLDNIHYTASDVMPLSFGFEADTLGVKFKEKAPSLNNYGQYNFGNIKYIYPGDSVFNINFSGTFDGERPTFFRAELYRNKYKYINPNSFFLFNTAILANDLSTIDIPGAYVKYDTVSILIYRLSPQSYNFYLSLRQLSTYEGGIFSSPAGNPNNNIGMKALGLFEASRVKKAFKIIK